MNPSNNLAVAPIVETAVETPPAARIARRGARNRRVLIVDDSLDDRSALRWFSESMGCIVKEASGLPEMAQIIAKWRPDLLVLDIIMPNSDGLDVMRELKNAHCEIPLFLMTGRHHLLRPAHKLGAAYGLNVVGAIRTPIRGDDFKAKLRGAFATWG
jgi:CheY-like chemotaxis protein